jgi:hypothetical protein
VKTFSKVLKQIKILVKNVLNAAGMFDMQNSKNISSQTCASPIFER